MNTGLCAPRHPFAGGFPHFWRLRLPCVWSRLTLYVLLCSCFSLCTPIATSQAQGKRLRAISRSTSKPWCRYVTAPLRLPLGASRSSIQQRP